MPNLSVKVQFYLWFSCFFVRLDQATLFHQVFELFESKGFGQPRHVNVQIVVFFCLEPLGFAFFRTFGLFWIKNLLKIFLLKLYNTQRWKSFCFFNFQNLGFRPLRRDCGRMRDHIRLWIVPKTSDPRFYMINLSWHFCQITPKIKKTKYRYQ